MKSPPNDARKTFTMTDDETAKKRGETLKVNKFKHKFIRYINIL